MSAEQEKRIIEHLEGQDKVIQDITKICPEMAKQHCSQVTSCASCLGSLLYDEGYRKADEVRKETAREIFDVIMDEATGSVWDVNLSDLKHIIKYVKKQYGVEVDEC